MFPFIEIFGEQIPVFSICVIIGLSACLLYIVFKIKDSNTIFYILPKICLAFGAGVIGAIFFDSLFKIKQNGGFKIAGMTFYGGLIVGAIVFIALLAIFKKNRKRSITEWLNFITVPFLIFHFFGRMGCLMAGCCHGTYLGQDYVVGGIWMKGVANGWGYYIPVQLYEGLFLLGLAVLLFFMKKHNFTIYCYAYPTFRFLIEFLRADNRGSYFGFMSPAQLISVILIFVYTIYLIIYRYLKNKKTQPV